MWFGVLLICKVTMNDCMAITGPMARSEQECEEGIPHGIDYVGTRFPEYQVFDYRCISWGEAV